MAEIFTASRWTLSFDGFVVEPLPNLESASLQELRAAEWSGREPLSKGLGGGAWHSCQCCGAVKIDGKGHAAGCEMAAAMTAAETKERV
ncbi:MAG: hypothetical protein ACRYGP_13745 [Janthinobacterium lividum]